MFVFVRDLAGRWADSRFSRANRVLRYRLKLAEEARQQLTESVDRLKVRRGIDRDVRVRAETQVAELTQANLLLSGMLSEVRSATPAPVDPAAVALALKARAEAGESYVAALKAYLEADASYRNRFNEAYIDKDGPEHLRRAVGEDAAAGLRSVRDAAEGARVAAEQVVRDAELAFRAALAGAVADEAGERL